jgi:hypothetical protein
MAVFDGVDRLEFRRDQPVEVRCSFDGTWASGFVVNDVTRDGIGTTYVRVRRVSDGVDIPVPFVAHDVRPA